MENQIKNLERLNSVDRVRNHTPQHANYKIDRDLISRISYYSKLSKDEITKRIDELEKEWDVERYLDTQASITSALGLWLGLKVSKKWFWLIAVNQIFLFQHAVQGWCPPMAMYRRLGMRTRREIEIEKNALKFFRGDFGNEKISDDVISSLENILDSLTKK